MDANNVLTVREICDWWGLNRSTVSRHMINLWEWQEYDTCLLRKSGSVYLVNIMLVKQLYGEPKNEQPKYD